MIDQLRTPEGRERLLLGVGVGSLALAFVVAFAPIPDRALRPFVAWGANPTTVLLLAGTIGVLGLWSLRGSVGGSDSDPDAGRWRPARAPERANYDEHGTTGADVDAAFGAGDELHLSARQKRIRRSRARRAIRREAIATLEGSDGYAEVDATRALRTGEWTDDPRAAAFLADSGEVHVPLRTRIHDWATGRTFDRRAERAVDEIEARSGRRSP